MEESESDSGDSVIILSEDDLPTRQKPINDLSYTKKETYKNNLVKTVGSKPEESIKEKAKTRPCREVVHGDDNKTCVEKKEAVKHRNKIVKTVENKSEDLSKEKVKT